MIKAFLLCHDTKTKIKQKNNKIINQTIIQEHKYAFDFCNIFGFEFSGNVKITADKISSYKIKYFEKFNEFYPILAINDFTKERNRFSILVANQYSHQQSEEENKYTLYIWTKDISFVLDTAKMDYSMKEKLRSNCQKMNKNGLQIMFYLKKDINISEKITFLTQKGKIISGLNYNLTDLDQLYTELEKNAEFLIGAAYGSPLKPHVKETISSFQEAKMKLYLISGEDEDNTMAVAFKSGFIGDNLTIKKLIADSNETLFVMMKYIFNTFKKEINEQRYSIFDRREEKNSTKKSIIDFQNKNKFILITNGSTLDLIFQNNFLSNHFKFLLLFCSHFIGFDMNQIVNKELVKMVKALYGKSNEKIMVIGNSIGDLALMQEANVSIEINEIMLSQIITSNIVMDGFQNLNKFIFIWSKISFDRIYKTMLFIFFAFSLLTYLRFFTSFLSDFSQSEIIPRLFFFLFFKNFLIWLLFGQLLSDNMLIIVLLKRIPLLYRQKNWQNDFEIKYLLLEYLIQPLLFAIFIIGTMGIASNEFNLENITNFRAECYAFVTIFFFFKVNLNFLKIKRLIVFCYDSFLDT